MRTIVIGAAAALLLWTGGAAAIPFSGTASGSWTGVSRGSGIGSR